ncbi:MAG TPA: type 2 isopentenyl-diphosphate Delta-isomerase [Microbacteriaceae bacterium]|nr:type 2 isopentenyl-diphosphate Delta-isomerase [Microbacteriaceae bacterium]
MIESAVDISASRKDDHVRHALTQADNRNVRNDFDDIAFIHHALDAIDVQNVSLSTDLFNRKWSAPLYINAMTGGSEKTGRINSDLARVANETGIAVASGSLSQMFKDPDTTPSFKVLRDLNPNGIVIANVNANTSVDNAKRAVDTLQADALQIHINSAQELAMPEGDREFAHWTKNIGLIVNSIGIPVVVKEVGFGISLKTTRKLAALGVKYVDTSGRGGTNFAQIEQSRTSNAQMPELAFWGNSTVQSLLDNSALDPQLNVTLLASGGVRSSLDVARALALGAKAVGVAGGFLHTLHHQGAEALMSEIERWKDNLVTVQALLGLTTPTDFTNTQLFISGRSAEFSAANNIDVRYFALRQREEHPNKNG